MKFKQYPLKELTDADQLDIYNLEKDIIDLKIQKVETEDADEKASIDDQIEDKKVQIQSIKDISENIETKNLHFHYYDFENMPTLLEAIKQSL